MVGIIYNVYYISKEVLSKRNYSFKFNSRELLNIFLLENFYLTNEYPGKYSNIF